MKCFQSFRKPTAPRLQQCDLAWVDEFMQNVRPYIFVREEDRLLIKRPNQVQQLNAMGAKILKALLDGMPIARLLSQLRDSPDKLRDVAHFLHAVRECVDGNLDRFSMNPALDVQPFAMRFNAYPVLSELALTYRCNLRCAFCYAGSGCSANPTGSADEMDAETCKTIIWKIRHQAKAPSISFTGGEPTLIPFLPEVIRHAKSLDMRVNLITNGTLITREMARQFADAGLDSAQVSVEGVTAETHDALVGMVGAFEKSVAAVALFKQAGIFTHTNTTLTRRNVAESVRFPQFVRDTLGNERFSMNLMIPTGNGALDDNLILTYREIGTHVEAIRDAAQRAGVEFLWYSPVPMCLFNSIPAGLGNKGCSACDGLISVGANGDVLPCASYDMPVGNLVRQDFADIWHSETATMFREKQCAPPSCQTCEQFAICNGACPLYWRKMGYGELSLAKIIEPL